ncbi:MAG: SDR family oxidoreductase [Candidatus Poribacteria bacterium]|nr:SDR family oxidoreductase [Candidatus Poribacteria bacterium]
MNKIVLTGASGLLGRAIMAELSTNFDIIGLGLNRIHSGIQKLNLLDTENVNEFMWTIKPNILIHSAAERRPDISQNDPQRTVALNVEATRHLAKLAYQTGCWMIFLSTNYVFDGTSPPYRPKDSTNPLNLYGQSKLDGENAVRAETDQFCILRLPALYGQVEFLSETSITQIGEQIRSAEKISIDHWSIRRPTWVNDVAVVCRQIIEHRSSQSNFNGTYHWSANEPMTKYQIAKSMGEVVNCSTTHLIPDVKPPVGVPRPQDCELDCSDLVNLGIGQQTPFQKAIYHSLISFFESTST